MDRVNAFVFTLEEYDRFLNEISNGSVGICNESGEWFYVAAEDIEGGEICGMIGKALNVCVTDVIVDITSQKVAIVY